MTFYLIFILLVLLLLVVSKLVKNQKIKKITLFLSCFLLIAVSALRYNVGTDYNTYYKWYLETLGQYYKKEIMYIPFQAFMTFLGFFWKDPIMFFSVTSIIINVFMFKFIVDNQEDYLIAVLAYICLFFYFSTFNLVRQWIAVALCLYSIKYIKNNNFWKYCLFNILAILTHYTAIIFFPVYFMTKIKLSKSKPLIIVLCSFFLFKVLGIWSFMFKFIKVLFPFYYERYLLIDNSNVNGIFYFLISAGIIIVYNIFYKKLKEKYGEKEFNIRQNLLTICSIFCLLSSVSQILNRLSLFFVPLLIIFIPDTLIVCKDKKQKVIFTICGIIFLILYCIRLLLFNIHEVIPYAMVFS